MYHIYEIVLFSIFQGKLNNSKKAFLQNLQDLRQCVSNSESMLPSSLYTEERSATKNTLLREDPLLHQSAWISEKSSLEHHEGDGNSSAEQVQSILRIYDINAVDENASNIFSGEGRSGLKDHLVTRTDDIPNSEPFLNEDTVDIRAGSSSCWTLEENNRRHKLDSTAFMSSTVVGTDLSPDSGFQCKICNKKYSRKYSLRVHQRVHTGEMPFTCDECKTNFKWRSGINKHQKTSRCSKNFMRYRKSLLLPQPP